MSECGWRVTVFPWELGGAVDAIDADSRNPKDHPHLRANVPKDVLMGGRPKNPRNAGSLGLNPRNAGPVGPNSNNACLVSLGTPMSVPRPWTSGLRRILLRPSHSVRRKCGRITPPRMSARSMGNARPKTKRSNGRPHGRAMHPHPDHGLRAVWREPLFVDPLWREPHRGIQGTLF